MTSALDSILQCSWLRLLLTHIQLSQWECEAKGASWKGRCCGEQGLQVPAHKNGTNSTRSQPKVAAGHAGWSRYLRREQDSFPYLAGLPGQSILLANAMPIPSHANCPLLCKHLSTHAWGLYSHHVLPRCLEHYASSILTPFAL